MAVCPYCNDRHAPSQYATGYLVVEAARVPQQLPASATAGAPIVSSDGKSSLVIVTVTGEGEALALSRDRRFPASQIFWTLAGAQAAVTAAQTPPPVKTPR